MSKDFIQMTDDTDGAGGVGAWIPSQHFTDMIMEGIVQYGQLSGKITAMNYDLAAGNGSTVNVRYVSPRPAASCPQTGDGCLSAVSNTFGDYTVTVAPMGDYDTISNWVSYRAKGNVVGSIINEMSKRLAEYRDSALWTDLCAATPNTTIDTSAKWSSSRTTDSCCNYAFDIYNAIIDARQHLFGDGYNPDTVIIHPYAASYLYYKENGNLPAVQDIMPLVKYGEDGYIKTIAGMRVIEAMVAVKDDADPSAENDELAFVIDSSRALAEVWGMRPTFNEFYNGQCNRIELSVWTYWGHDQLDESAIVAIENPA